MPSTVQRCLLSSPVDHPFLSFLEVKLLRWLSRSPRIGLIMVKQYGTNISWVIDDRSDPNRMPVREVGLGPDEEEPPACVFERMYHAPDAER